MMVTLLSDAEVKNSPVEFHSSVIVIQLYLSLSDTALPSADSPPHNSNFSTSRDS